MTFTMRGARDASEIVTDFLKVQVPIQVEALKTEWGLNDTELILPKKYYPHEPPALDRWPVLATVVNDDRIIRRMDYGSSADETNYMWSYAMRVFVWCNSKGMDAVQNQRDDLTTLVRILLLSEPSLGSGGRAYVEETTMSTSFSDVTPVKGERYVAGAFIAFDMRLEETLGYLTAQTRNTVQEVYVEGQLLPVHPALQ